MQWPGGTCCGMNCPEAYEIIKRILQRNEQREEVFRARVVNQGLWGDERPAFGKGFFSGLQWWRIIRTVIQSALGSGYQTWRTQA